MRHQTIIRCVIKIQLLRMFGFMYCNTDFIFSAFILLKQAIRDNVSDTSNLHSELITQTETPISVSLSLVRRVISKELLRYMFK